MSKPSGKCSFCGGPRLTKGHIWPESFGLILPSEAEYHEQRIGVFEAFESDLPGPEKWERIGTGPLHKKRPRNTCVKCNGGWMSLIESAALPKMKSLLLGEQTFLDQKSQEKLASFLTLVSMRVELTAHGMKTIPQSELIALKENPVPSNNWRIWIAKHAGENLKDYRYRYTAMHITSDPMAPSGPEYCNTHVTTLVTGQLYAHIFFSTDWPEFTGYEGASLVRLWPLSGYDIDTKRLPTVSDRTGTLIHEALSREGRRRKQP